MRRDAIPTPALVIDLDSLNRNIDLMIGHVRAAGMALRPHAKSHKCAEIARLLIDAGARGACCATIREAEALAAAAIPGLLITSPVVTDDGLSRLGRLLQSGADVMVVADDPDNIAGLAAAAKAADRTMPVLVDIDVGQHRTGCVSIDGALRVAQAVAAHSSLRFKGLQAYYGHLQHIVNFDERAALVGKAKDQIEEMIAALKTVGLDCEIVSGGGTGTAFIDPGSNVFTELQPGSFLFLDSCYRPVALTPQGNPFEPALFLRASIVSCAAQGRFIVNAGLKAFATDSGKPVPMHGAPGHPAFAFLGDEHGLLEYGADAPALPLGAAIEFLTPHCDPTVNLHDVFWVVRGDAVVDRWAIARGY